MKSKSNIQKALTILYSCVFCGQEKKAPDSGVQVAGLFLETAARPFPLASSASLLALREKNEHMGQLEAQTIKKTHQSQEAAGKQCFNCFFRLLSYSLNWRLWGASMKTRPWSSEAAAAQISRERIIRHPSFLRLTWSKEQNRAKRVHMYCCFIF